MDSRARPASQQLFDRDRQIAYSLAGRVTDGVRDCRRHGHGRQLAEALGAQRARLLVEFADEEDLVEKWTGDDGDSDR